MLLGQQRLPGRLLPLDLEDGGLEHDETLGWRGMGRNEVDRRRAADGHAAPNVRRAIDRVAGTRRQIEADVIRLLLEPSAVELPPETVALLQRRRLLRGARRGRGARHRP